jgi:hypothetical protein
MTQLIRTTLLDFPVLPHRDMACGTSKVSSTFVYDRKKVSSAETLKAFINKWRSIWLLSAGPTPNSSGNLFIDKCRAPLSAAAVKIVSGDFDHELFATLINTEKLPQDEALVYVLGEILIPQPMLLASLVAETYGVDHDLGLVRIYLDTYPDLIDEGRPFKRTEAYEQEES